MNPETPEPEKRLKLTRAADIRARKVNFLATDLIPLGTLTVLSGNSGVGKTTIALNYLAQLTRGELEGFYFGKPQSVIILSPEDDEAAITRPRLEAAGADLERVHFMSASRRTANGEIDTYIQFPNDIPLLVEAVKQTGAAAIMIDPIASLIAGNLDKREDVRASFDRLAAEVAKEYQLGIILIAHNRKGTGQVRHMVSGSTAITDAARSVLAVAKNDEDETIVLAVDKSSYSTAEGLNLAYRLTSVEISLANGQTSTVARAECLGASDVTVAELHARHSGEEQVNADRNAAQQFILEHLQGSPGLEAAAGDVLKAGRAAGFNDSEMKDARRRCRDPKVASRKSGFGAGWVWGVEVEIDDPQSSPEDTQGGTKVAKVAGFDIQPPSPPSLPPTTEDPTLDIPEEGKEAA